MSFLFLHIPNPTGVKFVVFFLKGVSVAMGLPRMVIVISAPFLTLSRIAAALFLSSLAVAVLMPHLKVYILKCRRHALLPSNGPAFYSPNARLKI